MEMSTGDEDLDLLLSLRDERVLNTPPSSLSPSHPLPQPSRLHASGSYSSDEDAVPRKIDMSIFREAAKDFLHEQRTAPAKTGTASSSSANAESAKGLASKHKGKGSDFNLEKFTGLRIKDLMLPPMILQNRFSEVRLIRLMALKSTVAADDVSGHWATAGMLIEKSPPRTSSKGKDYSIWKLGNFNGLSITLFLFGDAHAKNCKEVEGTVFGLFDAGVRKEKSEGFSLSVFSASQIVKLGASADYGVCKGKRKDGAPCTMVLNRHKGSYCKFHSSKSSGYSTMRPELKGGNVHRMFRPSPKMEGVYMRSPLEDKTNLMKPARQIKILSVDCLKKALSKADKVTTNQHSQGIRFLTEITANQAADHPRLGQMNQMKEKKRGSSASEMAASMPLKKQPGNNVSKKRKTTEGMIELDILSSDGEL